MLRIPLTQGCGGGKNQSDPFWALLMNRTLVWFRRDLRISDHAPLERAARRGQVIPVFVLDPALLHHPETGVARVAFMLSCLGSLDRELRQRGGRLILKWGDPLEILPRLVHSSQAEGIYAYSDCERIYGRARDARLNRILRAEGIPIRWFEPLGSLPELVAYPHYRQLWFEQMADPLIPTPAQIAVPEEISSEPIPSLAKLGLTPDEKRIPAGGTAAARQALKQFLRHKAQRYYWQLSYPSAEVTTGLSPYLKFGVISVRECVQTVQQAVQAEPDERKRRSAQQLISRLRWGSGFTQRFRYLPQLELSSLYRVFDQQDWDFDPELYRAWQEGRTGFPIVDAAARCLMATGGYRSLNFRVRAIYASFLSNLLGMDWRYGALHFMRHLIDGDCPIDHYQWAMQAGVTHCVDKTWTRIYNPGQTAVDRCDPEGSFIKRWLPELRSIPPEQLGSPPGYILPILNYKEARQRRVQKLDRLRQTFQHSADVIPHLALLPESWLPFGWEQFPSEIHWALQLERDLFPAPLDLQNLDAEERQALRTWLVAHVERSPSSHRKASPKPQINSSLQLSLLEL
ncbi:DNA photolyase family protein [Synechococcus sp. Nb3U1]|uniref:FAD-binding domain-containing protein n=1 Tax=Synechococcus sp. Nb3U1 TaxID=1914529 RepID=UPI001F30A1C4|nr:deoxyribodipyrimidine photo-lyase [Synechococcus sp. Nb3U1]MCF2970603.1 DNA photolyase family protein [Synechococcus sp. Nb3U1]